MSNLQQYVDGFDELPSLSETVNQIIDLFNKGDVDINVLEKALQKDPNLSIQVLKLSNSPFFGISGDVTSIKDACMIMGLTNVFNLVTAADIINSLNSCQLNVLDSVDFWEHSITTAIATTIILKSVHIDDPNAFLIGLLHDIGKLALDIQHPDILNQILKHQQDNHCNYSTSEKSILGFTHAELGAEITKHWNLNKELSNAILWHHNKDKITETPLNSALHLANFIVKGLDLGDITGNYISEFFGRTITKLGMNQKNLLELMKKLKEPAKKTPCSILFINW